MIMINYLTQVTICWGLFFLLYAVWLQKETFFRANRWYLLITLIAGLIIPLIEFQIPINTPSSEVLNPAYFLETITVTAQAFETNLEEIVITPVNESWSMQFVLLSIYWLGVLFFASRFIYGVFQIVRLAYSGKIVRKQQYILVKTNEVHLPFSFMDYMFWSEKVAFNQEDHEKILRHELSHIRGNHSIDVLITELLCIFLWCSPFIFLYKKALKNIHEYLADDAVLKDTPTKKYGQLLLKQSQSGLQIAQANNFIHSQLKNRIIMMTKTKSQRYSLLKYTAILPLFLLLVFSISAKNTFADFSPDIIEQSIVQDTIPVVQDSESDEVFNVVEEMPRFKGCEELAESERKACADKNMLMFVYKNIKYPAEARKNGIEGTIVTSFIIEKNGEITEPKILRSIGGGCDEEVLRIVESMPAFIPGKQRGKNVRVKYMLPVKFKLEGDTKKPNSNLAEKIEKKFPEGNVLYVLNGKVVNSLEHLDPKDIEKINVLKNEAAIEKYGEKGKDGVIEVITKYQNAPVVVGFGEAPPPPPSAPPPPPPAPAEPIEGEEIFMVVEKMPLFPGTADRDASNKGLLQFIYKNLKYPKADRELGIQGTSVVKFIITKDGTIESPKILRSVSGNMDKEVLRVVELMNSLEPWTPGYQRGRAVNVQFNLPIKFKLDNEVVEAEETEETDVEAEDRKEPTTVENSPFEKIDIYPNPSGGLINVHLYSKSESPTTVVITDASGKQLYKKVFNGREVYITDLELENASNGVLFFSFEQDGKVSTSEVVLQR